MRRICIRVLAGTLVKPGNSLVWHATVMDWLATYLGGARPEKEALDAVYSITK